MKLFNSLLVAPATLGLLTPIAASANEINLNEISNYSDVENIEFANSFNDNLDEENKTLIAGGEGMVHSHGSDSFSSTTSASFSADMAIGAVDGSATEDAMQLGYGYQIDLNTSFTGEDSLDISIDAGNGGAILTELDLNDAGTDDALAIDGISYTFPINDKLTVFVGDNVDGSSLYNTACLYGGITNTLDDCGNVESAMDEGQGTAAGASYDFGNGVTAAIGYTGAGSSSTQGLLTQESADTIGAQVTYNADSYGVSLSYANVESSDASTGAALDLLDKKYLGFNGYWSPAVTGYPSISVGYEIGNSEQWWVRDTSAFFLGFQWDDLGPGTFGTAIGTTGHIADDATQYFMYEAFYSYPVNDGMTITPVVYVKEASTDETGFIVKTSFRF